MTGRMISAAAAVGVWASSAMAVTLQDGTQALMARPESPWKLLGLSAAIVVAILAVAFKNARRTHLD